MPTCTPNTCMLAPLPLALPSPLPVPPNTDVDWFDAQSKAEWSGDLSDRLAEVDQLSRQISLVQHPGIPDPPLIFAGVCFCLCQTSSIVSNGVCCSSSSSTEEFAFCKCTMSQSVKSALHEQQQPRPAAATPLTLSPPCVAHQHAPAHPHSPPSLYISLSKNVCLAHPLPSSPTTHKPQVTLSCALCPTPSTRHTFMATGRVTTTAAHHLHSP